MELPDNVLDFMIELRAVGSIGCEMIQQKWQRDSITNEFIRKKQYIAVALVSDSELEFKDTSVLKEFRECLNKLSPVAKFIHHGRVSVVMNCSSKMFYTHGECRLFDPSREIVYGIIDRHTCMPSVKRQKHTTCNDRAKGLFSEMLDTFLKQFPVSNPIILVYSHFIPCDIDFHECCQVLATFSERQNLKLIIAYEDVYGNTNRANSKRVLKSQKNITLIEPEQLFSRLDGQFFGELEKEWCNRERPDDTDEDGDWDNVYLNKIQHIETRMLTNPSRKSIFMYHRFST